MAIDKHLYFLWLSLAKTSAIRAKIITQTYGSVEEFWDAFTPAMEKGLGEALFKRLLR